MKEKAQSDIFFVEVFLKIITFLCRNHHLLYNLLTSTQITAVQVEITAAAIQNQTLPKLQKASKIEFESLECAMMIFLAF